MTTKFETVFLYHKSARLQLPYFRDHKAKMDGAPYNGVRLMRACGPKSVYAFRLSIKPFQIHLVHFIM